MSLDITEDAFLGGRLTLRQPRLGYRAGQDPLLLSAAIAIKPGESFVDLGCGVGALALSLLTRAQGVRGLGVEQEAELAGLALKNAEANRLPDFSVRQGDLFSLDPDPQDWVLSNPPFFDPGSGRLSQNAQVRTGRHGVQTLERWLQAMMPWVRPRGRLGLIIPSDHCASLIAALHPRFGGIVLAPLLGRAGQAAAGRVIILAREGSRSATQIAPTLKVRDAAGALMPAAQSILAEGAAWPVPAVK